MTRREILHVDMDAFFAAIEQLDRPELRGRPVLVGGDPRGRGVVSTASYEARPFGCRSAMAMATAVRLCPQAVVAAPRMGRYVEVSRAIFEIFEHYTPLVEPLSIDEAFLDVTGSTRLFGPAERIARDLKRRVREQTGLTASVGVAPNKFLAKLASDLQKPDGLVIVAADGVQEFLDPLPIGRLWGVGKATLPKFEALGVQTFGDVRRLSETRLRDQFGDAGEHFQRLVRGVDDRKVVPDREAKSISHEVTFAEDSSDLAHLRGVLLEHSDNVARRLRRQELVARTVVLKIRRADFQTFTRRTTLDTPTDQTDAIWRTAVGLFEAWSRGETGPVRLIGMGVTQLHSRAGSQLPLFGQRTRNLDRTVDEIRERFGREAIVRGALTKQREE